MPSMVPMMSEIFRLLALMSYMVETTRLTTSPPWLATPLAPEASCAAWRAVSAFCFTVAVSCAFRFGVEQRNWVRSRASGFGIGCKAEQFETFLGAAVGVDLGLPRDLRSTTDTQAR